LLPRTSARLTINIFFLQTHQNRYVLIMGAPGIHTDNIDERKFKAADAHDTLTQFYLIHTYSNVNAKYQCHLTDDLSPRLHIVYPVLMNGQLFP